MYKKSFSLISFVLLLAMVSAGSAATYYVDFESGSDFNQRSFGVRALQSTVPVMTMPSLRPRPLHWLLAIPSCSRPAFTTAEPLSATGPAAKAIQLPTVHTARVTQLSTAQSQSLAYREQFLTVSDGLLRQGGCVSILYFVRFGLYGWCRRVIII